MASIVDDWENESERPTRTVKECEPKEPAVPPVDTPLGPARLRKWQIIYLQILSEARGPVTRDYLLSLVGKDYWDSKGKQRTTAYLVDDNVGIAGIRSKTTDGANYASLISLGLVTGYKLYIVDTRTPVFEITEAGRKALAQLDPALVESKVSPYRENIQRRREKSRRTS